MYGSDVCSNFNSTRNREDTARDDCAVLMLAGSLENFVCPSAPGPRDENGLY